MFHGMPYCMIKHFNGKLFVVSVNMLSSTILYMVKSKNILWLLMCECNIISVVMVTDGDVIVGGGG